MTQHRGNSAEVRAPSVLRDTRHRGAPDPAPWRRRRDRDGSGMSSTRCPARHDALLYLLLPNPGIHRHAVPRRAHAGGRVMATIGIK